MVTPLATPTNRVVVGAELREAGDVDEPSHVTLRTVGDAAPWGPTTGSERRYVVTGLFARMCRRFLANG
jgi:hypothetical protein